MERVDQVLNGLLLGEVRQVDEVFIVIAAGAETGARALEDVCFPPTAGLTQPENYFVSSLPAL